MPETKFPPGWDEARVERLLGHYESQSESEVITEDEACLESGGYTAMTVPDELVPTVRELIAKRHR